MPVVPAVWLVLLLPASPVLPMLPVLRVLPVRRVLPGRRVPRVFRIRPRLPVPPVCRGRPFPSRLCLREPRSLR
ncbi:hypothetical protein ACH49_02025 [Streptomyces leeuwenhoekii]|uniref:Secreted protein n=1 Tax=Streptomyces leeuwenhoekii TaxID=1437453 RepID=A0ABR5I554_STRLW|nr:hypothetical protein ACH49_02025 [Streptomyces leeuwenhoekii]